MDALIHLFRLDSYPVIVLEVTAFTTFPVAHDLAGVHDIGRARPQLLCVAELRRLAAVTL